MKFDLYMLNCKPVPMNLQDKRSVEELETLAKSLYSSGFDYAYIYKHIRRLSNDSDLASRIIGVIREDHQVQDIRARQAEALTELTTGDQHAGLMLGLVLIVFGIAIKSFVVIAGIVGVLPYVVISIGVLTVVRALIP
jgi:hypothetical protein